MKKIILFTITALMVGCTSTEQNRNTKAVKPIDLTNNKELVEEYWVLSERSFPKYPIAAARKNLNGCVNFELVIDSEGKPQDIKVIKSAPDNLFVSESTKALKKNRWAPSESNTSFQPVVMTFEWSFTLDGVLETPDCKVNGV